MASRREKLRTIKPFLSETRSHHSSGRLAPSSNHRSTSRVSSKRLPDAKKSARKRRFSCRREVIHPPSPQGSCRIISRLRVYRRNASEMRKSSHENGIPLTDAKSSSIRALRALIKSSVDFSYIKEMASRREKLRTIKPFLSETRSLYPSGRCAPSSNQRSTSRVSSKRLIYAKKFARESRFSCRREVILP